MADEDVINSGRDERGQFVSKQNIQAAAQRMVAKANADTESVRKQIDKIKGAYAALKAQLGIVFQKQSAGMQAAQKQVAKSMAAQLKTHQSFYKQVEKMRERDYKLSQKLFKGQAAEIRKLARAQVQAAQSRGGRAGIFGGIFSGGGGKGGLGIGGGISLPGLGPLIGMGAMIAAAKGLSSYITDLAWTREKARALGGDKYALPHKRDAEMYSQFAEQSVSNRYSSPAAIQGLTAIRDALQRKLGEELGGEITLKLTDALKGSRQELEQFLSLAATNVPRALAVFKSADLATFQEALQAVTQQENEVGKTAATIEQTWRSIKQAAEDVTTALLQKYGGDVRAAMLDVANGVIDTINYMGDLIDRVDEFGDGLRRAKEWLLGPEGHKPIEVVPGGPADRFLKYMGWGQEQEQQPQGEAPQGQGRVKMPKIPRITLPPAEAVNPTRQAVDAATKAIQAAAKVSREWWTNLTKTLSPVEQATLRIKDLDESLTESDAMVKRDMSRLNMLESSPLGFGQQMQATLDAVKDLNSEIDLLTQKYQEQQRIVAENVKAGRDGRADRVKALDLESQINDRMAERNKLLGSMQRGYLDAIGAQALGAGKFEKMIVSQDRNIGKGMRLAAIRNNPLVGSSTQGGNAPYRFGADMDQNLKDALVFEKGIRSRLGGNLPAPTILPPLSAGMQTVMGGSALAPPAMSQPASEAPASRNPGAGKLEQAAELLLDWAQEQKRADRQPKSGKVGVG
jgi:hypothetical protein